MQTDILQQYLYLVLIVNVIVNVIVNEMNINILLPTTLIISIQFQIIYVNE